MFLVAFLDEKKMKERQKQILCYQK